MSHNKTYPLCYLNKGQARSQQIGSSINDYMSPCLEQWKVRVCVEVRQSCHSAQGTRWRRIASQPNNLFLIKLYAINMQWLLSYSVFQDKKLTRSYKFSEIHMNIDAVYEGYKCTLWDTLISWLYSNCIQNKSIVNKWVYVLYL